ncbi:MAG: DUF1573 domain-containing protein [Planctomycetota bacterium]
MSESVTRKRAFVSPLAAVALSGLCVPAVWSWSASAAVERTAAASARAPLAFDAYLLNAGTSRGGGLLRGPYRFSNDGDRPVVIRDVQASCGCLTPEFSEEPIAPGEAGVVVLRADTAGETAGAKSFYADLVYAYADAEPGEKFVDRVHLKYVVDAPAITLSPKDLLFYQITDEPTRQVIAVTTAGGARVTGVSTSDADVLRAELLEPTASDPPGVTRVGVTAVGRPERAVPVLVRIATDDPRLSEVYARAIVTPDGRMPSREELFDVR